MTAQPVFEFVASHQAKPSLHYYAGFCFGWRKASQPLRQWVHAVVLTRRYLERALREVRVPLVLDNGAYPAFRDGRTITFEQQLRDLHESIEAAGPERIMWVIWPDVVGDPVATRQRILRTLKEFKYRSIRPLIPVQEGMDLFAEGRLALALNGGVFVGGKTRRWKLETVRRLRRAFPDLHIHVGRISSEGHLHTAGVYGANSFDTTTFMQGRGTNQFTDYAPRLERYAEKV